MYFRIMTAIVLLSTNIGYVLPMLISAKNTELVLAGIVLAIVLVPLFVKYVIWEHNNINKKFIKGEIK